MVNKLTSKRRKGFEAGGKFKFEPGKTKKKSKRGDQVRKRTNRYRVDKFKRLIEAKFGPILTNIPFRPLLPLNHIKDASKRKQWEKWYNIFHTTSFRRFVGRMPYFASMVYQCDKASIAESLALHINWYEDLIRNKGPVFTVKLLKRVRDACLRFAADQTFESISELKLGKEGLPLKVKHLMPYLTNRDIDKRRVAIHVLDIIKLCEVPGEDPSLESIITPPEGDPIVIYNRTGGTFYGFGKTKVDGRTLGKINNAYRSVLKGLFPAKNLEKRKLVLSSLSDIHMSVRKGPNGPAIGTVEEDFLALQNTSLLESITWFAKETHNNELLIILDELGKEFEPLKSELKEVQDTFITSRLSIKYEPWCKTRYFAICDYFSQSALKGLHKWIFKWLSKQPEDGTMSQDLVANTVRDWTASSAQDSSKGIYSLDLSKATDRLPATLQREIIGHIFGQDYADNWYTICTNRSFSTPAGELVQFKVGQPLGVYSSWAMLALTHHVVCQTALRLSGQRRNKKVASYVVIGDDVAMRGKSFSEWYLIIMSNILQVGISPTKGFTPETSLGCNPLLQTQRSVSAEIAKRVFVDGLELSVVSPETLKSSWEYPADFPNCLRQLTNRGLTYEHREPVAPIALATLGYSPSIACTLATFPLRSSVSKETKTAFSENYSELLAHIPWFQTDIPISDAELESMFKWSVRSGLQGVLDKFKDHFYEYIELSRAPKQYGDRMYHFRTKEYIVRILINKAMLFILSLVMQADALNFQGPGQQLDRIASGLNQMTDFHSALLGKPKVERENLHRLRSRVITKLQPKVRETLQKAKDNWGILLIDSGEQINFVPHSLVDITNQDLSTRSLLSSGSNRLLHDEWFSRVKDSVWRRTLEY